MMNYIGAGDGQFINLAAIVLVEDVSTETEQIADLTTLTGDVIQLKGDDAEAVFQRVELIALDTHAAAHRLQSLVNQSEGVPQ